MRRCGAGVGVGTAMVGAVAVVVEVVVAAEGKVKPGGTVRGFNRLEEPGGGAGLRRTGAGGAGFRDRVGVGGREVPPLRTPRGDGNTVDTKQPPVRYTDWSLSLLPETTTHILFYQSNTTPVSKPAPQTP